MKQKERKENAEVWISGSGSVVQPPLPTETTHPFQNPAVPISTLPRVRSHILSLAEPDGEVVQPSPLLSDVW